MTTPMYIQVLTDGTYKELTLEEFKASENSTQASYLFVAGKNEFELGLFCSEWDVPRQLDEQTQGQHIKHILLRSFPSISYEAASGLVKALLEERRGLFILQ